MSDVLTAKQRSYCMSRIKGKDTSPEIAVRRTLHKMGYRFRLHRRDLPGRPDIVLPRYKVAVFVHGCFWHMHRCQYGRVVPKTNAEFWRAKRTGTVARDRRAVRTLRSAGWRVVTIWECEAGNPDQLQRLLENALGHL